MIDIEIKREGELFSLEMNGHADFSAGNDIVCAGCSAIAYALWGWIHNRPEPDDDLAWHCSKGRFWIRARGGALLETAFEMAEIGFLQIAEKYPENVAVKNFSIS